MTLLRDSGCGFFKRRKGTPFAETNMGTWRGPDVFSYGRTLRTARSGGKMARGCLTDLSGGGGWGRRCGGARVRPRGREGIRLFKRSMLLGFPVEDESRWSRTWEGQLMSVGWFKDHTPHSQL